MLTAAKGNFFSGIVQLEDFHPYILAVTVALNPDHLIDKAQIPPHGMHLHLEKFMT
jgi:hypothetical protein